MRVLIAEDKPVSRVSLRRAMQRLGCQVDVVGSGPEAVAAASAMSYQLILLACDLAGMDGFNTAAEIRKREDPARHVPIVAIGESPQADHEQCVAAGMDDYLTSPVRLARLSAAVERWTGPEVRRAS